MSNYGEIEIITGGMYAGKTTRLIERFRELSQTFVVTCCKPQRDVRDGTHAIGTHDGDSIPAVPVAEAGDLLSLAEDEGAEYLLLDEAQFFGWDLVEAVLQLQRKGVHLIIVGLDLDFKGQPFGVVPELMAYADSVEKLHGTCVICEGPASRSQRLTYDKPAKRNEPVFFTGSYTRYEARCIHHHVLGD